MQIAFFEELYKSSDFMPHGDCLLWTPGLLWTHVGADIFTGIAYYLITTLLCYFIYKRQDTAYSFLFLLCGAFIFACGTTHFMGAWTIYYPSYKTEGIIKSVNAFISIITAIVMIPLMPKVIALPSLRKKNKDLAEENQKRKEAEEALRESEARYRLLFDHAADAIFIHDSQARMLAVNRTACERLGYTEKELTAMTVDQVDSPEHAQHAPERITRLMEQGHLTFETMHRHKNGSLQAHEVNARRITWNGQPAMMSIARDINERKKAEEENTRLQDQLNQAQKMESIGVLAGGIAHDFNNILGSIIGYADLARDNAPPGSELLEDIDKVLKSAQRAAELVKQILAFSRQAAVSRIPLKIQPLVKEALKMLRASLPTTINIEEDIHPQISPILADPTQVHQIIMNLCTNAFHAMEERGGQLSVKLSSTRLDGKTPLHAGSMQPGEYVELSVSDTGTGIEPDIIEKIFEPYFTTKGVGKGTGMGLAITHGIVKSYGGEISVESVIGQGTTFHIYFPAIQEETAEFEEFREIHRGSEHILFVDDEKDLVQMGQNMLERLGYTVTAKDSSLLALDAFKNDPGQFDLVITDQTMPEMTGTELASRILMIRPELPIILCTGFSSLVREESLKGIGIKKFVLKPYTKSALGKVIREVLEENRQAEQPGEGRIKSPYDTFPRD